MKSCDYHMKSRDSLTKSCDYHMKSRDSLTKSCDYIMKSHDYLMQSCDYIAISHVVTHHFDQAGVVMCHKEGEDLVVGREAVFPSLPHGTKVRVAARGNSGEMFPQPRLVLHTLLCLGLELIKSVCVCEWCVCV